VQLNICEPNGQRTHTATPKQVIPKSLGSNPSQQTPAQGRTYPHPYARTNKQTNAPRNSNNYYYNYCNYYDNDYYYYYYYY
jgi:hypothetical protein